MKLQYVITSYSIHYTKLYEGRMTIQQWNTASQGVDYRIGPRETKIETLTFTIPADAAPGEMKVTAVLNYRNNFV